MINNIQLLEHCHLSGMFNVHYKIHEIRNDYNVSPYK